MFFSKKKPSAAYDPAVQRPALRCSICTGEQVAGFVHPDGHFEDVQLVRTPQELAPSAPGTASPPETVIEKI